MKTLIPVTLVFAGVVACGSNPSTGNNPSASSAANGDNAGMNGGGGDNNSDGKDHKDAGNDKSDGGDHRCDLECPDGLVGGHLVVDLSMKEQTVKLDGDGSVKITNTNTATAMKSDWDSGDTDISLIIVHDGNTCDRQAVRPPDTEGTVVWDLPDLTITADSVIRAPVRELAFCFHKEGKTW